MIKGSIGTLVYLGGNVESEDKILNDIEHIRQANLSTYFFMLLSTTIFSSCYYQSSSNVTFAEIQNSSFIDSSSNDVSTSDKGRILSSWS